MTLRIPPVIKLLFRGYLVMGFVLLLGMTGLIGGVGIIILGVTIVSISMLFGVGILLMKLDRPVRDSHCDIPNTVLVFVKGAFILYFISLLGSFRVLPLELTALLMTGVAFVLCVFGVSSYVIEVFERAAPVKHRKKIIAILPDGTRKVYYR